MRGTYRLPRFHLYIALIGLPFYLAMAVAFIGGWVTPEKPAQNPIVLRWIGGGIPLGFCLLSVYLALAWRNQRLVVDGQNMTIRGTIGAVEIDLPRVSQAHWRMLYGGSIKLVGARGTATIVFRQYDIPSNTDLIEHLRQQIPAAVQTGWPWFEHNYLRRVLESETPGEGRVFFDRRRLDRILIPAAAAIVLTGAGASWWLRDARGLAASAAFAAMVLLMRYAASRDGHYAPTIRAACRRDPELKWMLALLPIAFVAKSFCKSLPNVVGPLAIALLIAMTAVIVAGLFRERRRRRQVEATWSEDERRATMTVRERAP